MRNSKISICIIEDHPQFREGLGYMINSLEEFQCSHKLSSIEEAENTNIEVDVLLLDINLPGKSGLDSIQKFKSQYPNMKIIMLTGLDDDEIVFQAIKQGADGYILKRSAPLKIISAIEDVVEGGAPLSPYIAKKIVDYFQTPLEGKIDYQLSVREREILSLLIDGCDSRTIASKLFISYETVRNHLKNIYQKLNVTSKIQAISKAVKERIIN